MRSNLKIYLLAFAIIFIIMTLGFMHSSKWVTSNSKSSKRNPFALNETWKVCQEHFFKSNSDEKVIFIVTPTYARPEQVAELTRLMQTLIHVKEVVHWIIAQDSNTCSQSVHNLLQRHFHEISHTVISAPMPEFYKVISRKKIIEFLLEASVFCSVQRFN